MADAADGTHLRFDASQNGLDFTDSRTPLTLYPNGTIGCGALTENNLQTAEERAGRRHQPVRGGRCALLGR